MLVIAIIATITAPVAICETPQSVLAAFENGRFEDAAQMASLRADSDSRAFAARALLASAMCGEDQPPQDLITRAETLAREAISGQPDHIEGRLQLAIALSLKARPLSTRDARKTGYGDTTRDLAQAVLRDDPGNAYAHGLLAVWNVEVVRRGGAFGSAIMGASVSRGLTHYREAITARPGDASIHWQMARALAALDARKYAEDIREALDGARAAPADDVLEQVMAARAVRLSEAMDTLGHREIEALAETML